MKPTVARVEPSVANEAFEALSWQVRKNVYVIIIKALVDRLFHIIITFPLNRSFGAICQPRRIRTLTNKSTVVHWGAICQPPPFPLLDIQVRNPNGFLSSQCNKEKKKAISTQKLDFCHYILPCPT